MLFTKSLFQLLFPQVMITFVTRIAALCNNYCGLATTDNYRIPILTSGLAHPQPDQIIPKNGYESVVSDNKNVSNTACLQDCLIHTQRFCVISNVPCFLWPDEMTATFRYWAIFTKTWFLYVYFLCSFSSSRSHFRTAAKSPKFLGTPSTWPVHDERLHQVSGTRTLQKWDQTFTRLRSAMRQ